MKFISQSQFIFTLNKKFDLLYHKGIKYTCPFCKYSSRDLSFIGFDFQVLREKQIIGGGLRRGGCYKCGSTDRERLIYIFIKEKLQKYFPGKVKRVLHIAPEPQLIKVLPFLGFEEYICGDLYVEGYHYPEFVQKIDLLKIPYEENYFDLIICNHVLEHIPDDLKAMREIRRVLSPEGIAILQVPLSKISLTTIEDNSIIDPKEREIAFGQFDHVRIYGQDYTYRLKNSGFKVNRINISSEYPQNGLNEEEDIFVCKKYDQTN